MTDALVPLEPAPPVYLLEHPYLNGTVVCRRVGTEAVPFYVSHACLHRV